MAVPGKARKLFGIDRSFWLVALALCGFFIWALLGLLTLTRKWLFAANVSISILSIFVLWRVLRKYKRDTKALNAKLDEMAQQLKNTRLSKLPQNGNGSKSGKVNTSPSEVKRRPHT